MARLIVTILFSSGWHIASSTCWVNSGKPSGSSTPRWATEISPGRGPAYWITKGAKLVPPLSVLVIDPRVHSAALPI